MDTKAHQRADETAMTNPNTITLTDQELIEAEERGEGLFFKAGTPIDEMIAALERMTSEAALAPED